MRKSKSIVVTLALIACAAGSVVVSGCSESGERQAARELLDKVHVGRKLYDRALALMANPLYRIGEDYPPVRLMGTPDPSEIFIPPGDVIHPDVLPVLNDAEKIIDTALRAQAGASPDDKALAQATLAHILSLKGYYHTIQAYRAMRSADRARAEANTVLDAAASRIVLLAYNAKLASASDEDVRKLRDLAIKDQTDTTAELKNVDSRVRILEAEKVTQGKAFSRYSVEAASLIKVGRDTPGQAGLEKFDEAMQVKAKANTAEGKVARIEYEIDSLKLKREGLMLDLSSARAQIRTAKELLEKRIVQASKNAAEMERIRDGLALDKKKLVEHLKALDTACQDIATSQRRSVNAYGLALNQANAADRAEQMNTAAQQGDVLVATADLKARCLAVEGANSDLARRVSTLWAQTGGGLPPELDRIRSFLGTPKELKDSRSDIEAKYGAAATLYRKAMRGVKQEFRWAYEGQVAVAQVRLYRFSQDATVRAEALKGAREALENALRNREFSPHLAAIRGMAESLSSEEE